MMTEPKGRPDFIPKEYFREFLSAGKHSQFYAVGNQKAGNFIQACGVKGRPIRSAIVEKGHYGFVKHYRPVDVIARARAAGLSIGPVGKLKVDYDIESLKKIRSGLQNDIANLRTSLENAMPQQELQGLAELLGFSGLYPEQDIVNAAKDFKRQCGIYFLVDDNRVVYVGQSINAVARVGGHIYKNFSKVAFIPCSQSQLNVLESLYIHYLKPPLNGGGSGNPGDRAITAPMSIKTIVEIVGLATQEG